MTIISANIGNFAISGLVAKFARTIISSNVTRSRFIIKRQAQSYCQPQIATTWFPVAPGVTTLPTAPPPVVNVEPLPPNAIALPEDFDIENPDLCSLFQDILPVNQPPVYGIEQTATVLSIPYNVISKLDALTRPRLAVRKLDYSLTLPERQANLQVSPGLFLLKDRLVASSYFISYYAYSANFYLERYLRGYPSQYIMGRPTNVLKYSRLFKSQAGSFSLYGNSSILNYSKIFKPETASFNLVGKSATLVYSKPAESGEFQLTGFGAGFFLDQVIGANNGTFVLGGQDAFLSRSIIFNASSSNFAVNGQDAELRKVINMPLSNTSFSYIGYDAYLEYSKSISANNGSFNLNGQQSKLTKTWLNLEAANGSITLNGYNAKIGRQLKLNAVSAGYIYTGQDINLAFTREILGNVAMYTMTGQSATMLGPSEQYWGAFAAQNYNWDADIQIDWWAD